MIKEFADTGLSRRAICDGCDDDEDIKGVRFVRRNCAVIDLCSDCTGRYYSESLLERSSTFRKCQVHELMKVLSNDRKELPDTTLNSIGETSEQLLTCLAKKSAAREYKDY